jgi:prepilin-type N-terminal cleavage/methylation domain-containing protein
VRRGFSLIEILIAILVLAFGLLGLGALFPVVVSQQRDAADRTQGPAAASSIRASLFGGTTVADWEGLAAGLVPSANAPEEQVKRWAFAANDQSGLSHNRIRAFEDGSLTLNAPGQPAETIPAVARVYPSPFSSVSPQFVWDVALRRTSAAQPMEVALFVRRLDTGIRAPRGKSVSNVLTGLGMRPGGNSPIEPTAVPVAVSAESGRPTGNGVGDYARLREVRLTPRQPRTRGAYDRCEIELDDTLRPYLARRGQVLLDDEGIIRTVVNVDDEGLLVVEPAFSPANPQGPPPGVRWAVYSPQIPVSVEIVRVEEGS